MTKDEKTIRMANQIASFFRSKPESEAVAGVAEHINKFWEKRMRTHLFELFDRDMTPFHKLVVEAKDAINRP